MRQTAYPSHSHLHDIVLATANCNGDEDIVLSCPYSVQHTGLTCSYEAGVICQSKSQRSVDSTFIVIIYLQIEFLHPRTVLIMMSGCAMAHYQTKGLSRSVSMEFGALFVKEGLGFVHRNYYVANQDIRDEVCALRGMKLITCTRELSLY